MFWFQCYCNNKVNNMEWSKIKQAKQKQTSLKTVCESLLGYENKSISRINARHSRLSRAG